MGVGILATWVGIPAMGVDISATWVGIPAIWVGISAVATTDKPIAGETGVGSFFQEKKRSDTNSPGRGRTN